MKKLRGEAASGSNSSGQQGGTASGNTSSRDLDGWGKWGSLTRQMGGNNSSRDRALAGAFTSGETFNSASCWSSSAQESYQCCAPRKTRTSQGITLRTSWTKSRPNWGTPLLTDQSALLIRVPRASLGACSRPH